MKRWPALVLTAALAAPLLAGDTASSKPDIWKPVKNEAFKAGEKLEFVLKYEVVSAGSAVMEVQDGPPVNGRPTLNITSMAKSNSVIDKAFRVRDFNGSQVDAETLVSIHFHQNLKEGKYQVIRNTGCDYTNHSYRYETIHKGKTSTYTGKLEEPVQDILSAFFVTRTLPLELGKEYVIKVFSDETIYPLVVRVGNSIERVKVPAGKFDCIRVDPAVQGDAIFKASDGKMSLWLTNDARHMPVLIRSKVSVGAFDGELVKYKN
jgi:hypothetical protein